jgi:hypothetical protein
MIHPRDIHAELARLELLAARSEPWLTRLCLGLAGLTAVWIACVLIAAAQRAGVL